MPPPLHAFAGSIQAIVKETLEQYLAQQAKPKPFSSVGSTEAGSILADLQLIEIRGNALQPFQVPAGTPSCSTFDYSKYADEEEGTGNLLEHHAQQLASLGVKFGVRGGFEMHDTHRDKQLYRIRAPSGQEYVGNVDCVLAPYGIASADSASREARILYEHKQSPKQKTEYQASRKVRLMISPKKSLLVGGVHLCLG